MCGQVFAFPSVPPDFESEPNVPLPAGIVRLHSGMLEVLHGIDGAEFSTDSSLVRCGLLLQYLTSLRAFNRRAYSKLLRKPSRAQIAKALLRGDSTAIVEGYKRCIPDGIPEIQEQWDALVRMFHGRA